MFPKDDVCITLTCGNWDTIGTCFLAPSWYNSDIAKFAGSCIGIAFWVILTEYIRRCSREFDRYIVREATKKIQNADAGKNSSDIERRGPLGFLTRGKSVLSGRIRLYPTVIQQSLRALLYAIQFTSAYLIMLIAMTYNGYVLLSIILGALVGYFFSTWDTLGTVVISENGDLIRQNVISDSAQDVGLWTDGNLSGHPEYTQTNNMPTIDNHLDSMESEKPAHCSGSCCPVGM